MLDYNYLIENMEESIKRLNNRGKDYSYLKKIKFLVEERNNLIFKKEQLKKQKNIISKEISNLIKTNQKNSLIISKKNKIINDKKIVVKYDNKLLKIKNKILDILLNTPNIPYKGCPIGVDENDNKEITKFLKPNKKLKKPHWEIANLLKIVDFEAARILSGSRFIIYKNKGALLLRALINYIIDYQTNNDYIEYFNPFIVNKNAMYGTGQFPKFIDDAYITLDEKVLIPTAEVSLTNMFRNKVVDIKIKPLSLISYSQCFRKEAGGLGKDTKGFVRLHQFSKIELVKISNQEDSDMNLIYLLNDAKKILENLKLPYRVRELCTGDLGFSANKTYDIEVWMPHKNNYMEISSCSNFGDYQSRRINIKYKGNKNKKLKFAHTINGSALAIDRLIAAILENFWDEKLQKVHIPEVLQSYMKNLKFL